MQYVDNDTKAAHFLVFKQELRKCFVPFWTAVAAN
jgi:hypothetical protein